MLHCRPKSGGPRASPTGSGSSTQRTRALSSRSWAGCGPAESPAPDIGLWLGKSRERSCGSGSAATMNTSVCSGRRERSAPRSPPAPHPRPALAGSCFGLDSRIRRKWFRILNRRRQSPAGGNAQEARPVFALFAHSCGQLEEAGVFAAKRRRRRIKGADECK